MELYSCDTNSPYGIQRITVQDVASPHRFQTPYQIIIECDSDGTRDRLKEKIIKRTVQFPNAFPTDVTKKQHKLSYAVDSHTGYQLLNVLRSHEFQISTKDFLELSEKIKVPLLQWKTDNDNAKIQEVRLFKSCVPGKCDIFIRFNSTEDENIFRYRMYGDGQTGFVQQRVRLCQEEWIPHDDDPKSCFIEGKYIKTEPSQTASFTGAQDEGIVLILRILKEEFSMPKEAVLRLENKLPKFLTLQKSFG